MAGERIRAQVGGVSLNVAKGEVLALIGESGTGKSTISLAAMGFGCPLSPLNWGFPTACLT